MSDYTEFDIFLAHNSKDKPLVRTIANRLKLRNLKPWLDEDQILAGIPVQDQILEAIPKAKAAAVFIGANELGNWEKEEARALLTKCKNLNKPIFLVKLTEVQETPVQLDFIGERLWVSLENGIPKALDDIESGIKGEKVNPFFEALLCYREEDGNEVKQIEKELKAAELNLWGKGLSNSMMQGRLLKELDKHQSRISSMIVFIGKTEGVWEKEVIEDIILEFRDKHLPVIPVILKSLEQEPVPKLPVYIRRVGKVDLREKEPDPIRQILYGITGDESYRD
jgi:hypothetical protein